MNNCFGTLTRTIFPLTIFLIGLSVFECTRSTTDIPHDQMQEIYVDEFKLTYFQMLLKKSYNNSNSVQEIIMQDHSHFTEPVLSLADYNYIDSLTTLDNASLKADSANTIGRVA